MAVISSRCCSTNSRLMMPRPLTTTVNVSASISQCIATVLLRPDYSWFRRHALLLATPQTPLKRQPRSLGLAQRPFLFPWCRWQKRPGWPKSDQVRRYQRVVSPGSGGRGEFVRDVLQVFTERAYDLMVAIASHHDLVVGSRADD